MESRQILLYMLLCALLLNLLWFYKYQTVERDMVKQCNKMLDQYEDINPKSNPWYVNVDCVSNNLSEVEGKCQLSTKSKP